MSLLEKAAKHPKVSIPLTILIGGVLFYGYNSGKHDVEHYKNENAPVPVPTVAAAAARHNKGVKLGGEGLICKGFSVKREGGALAIKATLNNTHMQDPYLTTEIVYRGGEKPGAIDGLHGEVPLPHGDLGLIPAITVVAHVGIQGEHMKNLDCGLHRIPAAQPAALPQTSGL